METKEELETTRKIVEEFLRDDILCRNSDKWLIFKVLEKICQRNGVKIFVPFNLFERFPAYETISRIRRKIQNDEKMFPPTDPVIVAKRTAKERRFRREFRHEQT